MKLFLAATLFLSVIAVPGKQKDCLVGTVNLTPVKLSDKFWLPRSKNSHAAIALTSFATEHHPALPNNAVAAKTTVPIVQMDSEERSIATGNKTVAAIQCCAWVNRGKGKMMVWFPAAINDIDLISNEQLRRPSLSSPASYC